MKTTIASLNFPSCIMNASGPRCTTFEDLKALGLSSSGAIVTKSCTLEARGGNPEPRYKKVEDGSINSMGLPNLGYKKYVEFVPELKKYKKPLIVSVSGLQLADNLEIIKAFNKTDVDAIELNLSCPNIVGKAQVGYDFEQSEEVLREVKKICKKPLGTKLPPYFDFVHFEQMASLLNKHKVDFVTCINSIGNGLIIDPETEKPLIKPKGGFGGIGGKFVKPTALANVKKMHELLDKKIGIIGVGGIYSGVDIFEFILAGARAVQVGTIYQEEGVKCFDRLNREFENYCAKKGYSKIEDMCGKLKPL
ncbi:MAG TPA: dihydroorotate oxidase [archaeon]|nr:dihydroorotate oxidase [archaeon]